MKQKTNIDHWIGNLRKDQNDAGVELAIQAFAPTPVTPRRAGKWAWRTVAVTGAVALVALGLMIPQRTSAAASFDRLAAAQRRSTVMFHVRPFWLVNGKRTPKIWSGYVLGHRWRYVQDSFEQAFDGVSTVTFNSLSGEPMATTVTGAGTGTDQVLKSAFIDTLLSRSTKDLKLEHNVPWRGKKVDKYVYRFTFTDEQGVKREGVSNLYADPVRGLPLYFEDIYSPTKGNALEWTYIEPANEELLRIKLPRGIKVRDVSGQQKTSPLGLPSKAQSGQ